MSRVFQVPRGYMSKSSTTRRRRVGGCACPSGAKMISTKGHGRGFACQANKTKIVKKRGRTWVIKKPFVKAICH